MTLLKSTVKKNLPLIILLFVSIGVVFYQYLSIPRSTTFDEIEFAKLALLLEKQSYVPYSFYATGHATLYFYFILLSFKIFGLSLLALRIPSAIFGVMNPLILFFVFNLLFPDKNKPSIIRQVLPLLLTLIFITMRWYFNFSRFGFEVTFLLFLELSSLYLVLKYNDRKRLIYLILAGVFAGLAYNSYQPGRIFAVIPLFALFSGMIKKQIKPFIYFLLPFFILILPLLIYLNIHKDTRFYQQFYPDNHEMTLQEKGNFFLRNLSSTAGIFNVRGDVNGRHNYPNKPALNPILGLLFLGGLGIAIYKIKDKNNQLFLLWFLLSLAPTLVTYPWENPNMLRTFTVIPSVVYLIGLSIQQLSTLPIQNKPMTKKLFMIFLFVIISVSSLYELRTYFVHQAEVFKEAFEAERPFILYLNPSDVKK